MIALELLTAYEFHFRYEQIRSDYPELKLPPVKSDLLTLKTIVF